MRQVHGIACSMCKQNKGAVKHGDGFHSNHPGEELSVDYQGKISPKSVRGYCGYYAFRDKYTGYRHAIMVKDKTADTYLIALQKVINFYNSHGHVVETLRCDAGTTENDDNVVAHLNKHHSIVVQPAAVGKQSQNPVERNVQTSIKGVGCLLLDKMSLNASW